MTHQSRKSAAQVVTLKEAPLSFVAGIIECRTWNTSVYLAEEQFSVTADYYTAHVMNMPTDGMLHVGVSLRPPPGQQQLCPGLCPKVPSMGFASRTGELLSSNTVIRCGPTFGKGDTIGVMIRFDQEAAESRSRKAASARRRGTEVSHDEELGGLRVLFLKNNRVVFQEPLILPEGMTRLEQAGLCPCIAFSGPGAKVKISELVSTPIPEVNLVDNFTFARNIVHANSVMQNTSHSDDHEGGVQLCLPLTPENNFYEVTVVSFEGRCEVTVGLGEENQDFGKQPAIAFRSENSSITNLVKKLPSAVVNQGKAIVRGDCVGCGIYFPERGLEQPPSEGCPTGSVVKLPEEAPPRRARPTLVKRASGMLPGEMQSARESDVRREQSLKRNNTVAFRASEANNAEVDEDEEETVSPNSQSESSSGLKPDGFGRRQTRRSMAINAFAEGGSRHRQSVALNKGFNPNEVGSVKRGEVFWTLNDIIIGSSPVALENDKVWFPYIKLGASTAVRFNPILQSQVPDHCTASYRAISQKMTTLNKGELARRFGNCLAHGCYFNGRCLTSTVSAPSEPCGCLFMRPLSLNNPYFEVVVANKSPMSIGLCAPLPEFNQHPPKKHVGKFQQSIGFLPHNGVVWVGSESCPYQTEIRCQLGDTIRVGGIFSASGEFGHGVYFAINGEVFGEFTVLMSEKTLCPAVVMMDCKAELEVRFPKVEKEAECTSPRTEVDWSPRSNMTRTTNRSGFSSPSPGTCVRSTLARRTVHKSTKELQKIVDAHEAAIRAEEEANRAGESVEDAKLRQRKEKAKDFKSNFAEAIDTMTGTHIGSTDKDSDKKIAARNTDDNNSNEVKQQDRFAAIRRCSQSNSVKYGLSPFVHRRSLQKYQAFVPDFNFDMSEDVEEVTTTRMLNKQYIVDLVQRKSLEPHALQGALKLLLKQTDTSIVPRQLSKSGTGRDPKDNTIYEEDGYLLERCSGSASGIRRNSGKIQPMQQPEAAHESISLPQISPRRTSGTVDRRVSFGSTSNRRALDSALLPSSQVSSLQLGKSKGLFSSPVDSRSKSSTARPPKAASNLSLMSSRSCPPHRNSGSSRSSVLAKADGVAALVKEGALEGVLS